MRFIFWSLLLGVFSGSFCFSSKTYSVDVSFDGYFRSRGNFYNNLDLDRRKTPANRAYTDFRFRLNPSFFVSDKIRIRTSLNFLDGTLGDNPFRGNAYNNPALSKNLHLDPTGTESTIGNPTGSATNSYGGAYATDGEVRTSALQAIYLRRAWAEIDIPYGTLKVGRMPNDFGMGIFANAGDDVTQEIGSSRDRIMFDTAFGNYYVRPGVGWTVEGKLDESTDDFYEYFMMFGRKNEEQEVGFYLSYNGQDAYRAESGVTVANTALNNAETGYWAFDFYFQNQFSFANLKAEGVIYSGKYVGKDMLAINGVLRSEFNRLGKLSLLTELGYSSGTSDTDVARNKIKTFAFSRDYDISLLVFEEALPGGRSLKTNSGAESNLASAPHSGAIANTYYGRVKLEYDANSYFRPAVNVVVPFAAKEGLNSGGSFYGIEYDVLTYWPINRYWAADFSFGHFIPSSFYDHVSRSHSAYLVRLGLVTKF